MKREEIIGKTISDIIGLNEESEKVEIVFSDGTAIIQYHSQNCCEEVIVSQVDGIINKHIGATIIELKEKIVTCDMEEYVKPSDGRYEDDSSTATFYTLKTSKGYLDWRWQGSSNGYYSESVDIKLVDNHKG